MKKFIIKSTYSLISTAFFLTVLIFIDIVFEVSQTYKESLLKKKQEYLTQHLSKVYKEFQLYTRVVSFDKENRFNLIKTLNDLTNSSSDFSSFYYVNKKGGVIAHSTIFTKNKKQWKSFSKRKWFSKLKSKSYNNDFQRGLANLVVGFEKGRENLSGYIYENSNESNVLVGYFSLKESVSASFKDEWDVFKYSISKKVPRDKFKYTAKKINSSILTDSPYYLVGQLNFSSPVTLLLILSLIVALFTFSSFVYYCFNVNRFFHDLSYDEMKSEINNIETRFNNFFEYETKIQNLSSFVLEKKEHVDHLNALMTSFESSSVNFCDETINENNHCHQISKQVVAHASSISNKVDKLELLFDELRDEATQKVSKLEQSIKVEILNTKLNVQRNNHAGFDESSLKNFSNHDKLLKDLKQTVREKLGNIKEGLNEVKMLKASELAKKNLSKYSDSFQKLDDMLTSIHDINVKVSAQGRAYISELSRLISELDQVGFPEDEHNKLERLKTEISDVKKALDFKKSA